MQEIYEDGTEGPVTPLPEEEFELGEVISAALGRPEVREVRVFRQEDAKAKRARRVREKAKRKQARAARRKRRKK